MARKNFIRKGQIICPKCGRFGFWTVRMAGKKYYPRFSTTDVILLEKYEKAIKMSANAFDAATRYRESIQHIRKTLRGYKYRGKEEKEFFDREACYHKLYRYKYGYIGHYDSEKYKKQMEDYRAGKRKSRPNGRKWCGPFSLKDRLQ